MSALLLAILATDTLAQQAQLLGLQCPGPHTGHSPDEPTWTQGPGDFWNARCSQATCDATWKKHMCDVKEPRHQAQCPTAAVTNLITDAITKVVPTLSDEQLLAGAAVVGFLGMLNANRNAAVAAARAEEAARAAEAEAERLRQEQLDQERLDFLNANLTNLVPDPNLQSRFVAGAALRPMTRTGAFGTTELTSSAGLDATKFAREPGRRDVNTPLKQLACAGDIARKAAGASTPEDIFYLAKEVTAATNGISWGEPCEPLKLSPGIDRAALARDIAALREAATSLAGTAEAAVIPSSPPPPAPAPAATNEERVIASAFAEQTAFQRAEAARIAEIARQGEDAQRRERERLAPVREQQQQLNDLVGALPLLPPEPGDPEPGDQEPEQPAPTEEPRPAIP